MGVGAFLVALVGIAGPANPTETEPVAKPVVAQPAAEPNPPNTTSSVPEDEANKLRRLALKSDVASRLVGDALGTATAGNVGPWYDDDGTLLGYGVMISFENSAAITTDQALAARLPGAYENVTGIVVFLRPDGTTLNVSVLDGVLDPKAAASLEQVRPGELPE